MHKMGFLRGAVLGLLAGLLVAPKSGKETRDNIKKHYEEITDRICDEVSRMKAITKETYAEVVGAVVCGFEEARKITAEEAVEIKEELKKGFEEIRKSHEKDRKSAASKNKK
ncbi:MAG: YtxH domain-containing protein [Candidatus Aminicenantes bacterium]|nr:MAG: YtxH domain-containing protein [Candidatus Aminicenantes bacterium]